MCVSRNRPKSDRCHIGDESPNLSGIGLRCVEFKKNFTVVYVDDKHVSVCTQIIVFCAWVVNGNRPSWGKSNINQLQS